MSKIHRFEHGKFSVLEVYKWLRTVGQKGIDYEVLSANYKRIEIKFSNNRVELEYIMLYEWTNGK